MSTDNFAARAFLSFLGDPRPPGYCISPTGTIA
jgi:hypothetical protein